jgi:hypothetical protein
MTTTEKKGASTEPKRVLVACEFSGIVRDAFRARGHDAWSCDLLPSERPSDFHLQGDVLNILYYDTPHFDLMIAHPPCTYLATSGNRWMAIQPERKEKRKEAVQFFDKLLNAPIPRKAVENPVSVISTAIRPPDQVIQPWEFGHPEIKKTCLWLVNLPPLKPTNIIKQSTLDQRNIGRVHHEVPSPDRWKNRSRTYQGIADAMADQWGSLA